MKPKLHRSVTFWAGIFVILSVLGIWWDSMRFYNAFTARNFAVFSRPGALCIHLQDYRPFVPEQRHFFVDRGSVEPRWADTPAIARFLFLRGGGEPDFHDPFTDDPHGELTRKRKAFDLAKEIHELLRIGMSSQPPTDWVLVIPYWLVLTAATGLFAASMLWRSRCLNRPLLDLADPPP